MNFVYVDKFNNFLRKKNSLRLLIIIRDLFYMFIFITAVRYLKSDEKCARYNLFLK